MKNRIGSYIRAISLLMALLVALGHSRPALANELNYNFHQINAPGATFTDAQGINDRGDIVGSFDLGASGHFGFLLRKGVFMTLAVPNAAVTVARSLNNNGDIVGFFFDTTGAEHGFLLRKSRFTVIDFPGGLGTEALGINDFGDIVGDYFDASGFAHGFLLAHADTQQHGNQHPDADTDGTFQTIAYPGAIDTVPTAINAKGEIVGVWDTKTTFDGFVLKKGRFVTVDFPTAIGATSVNGISNRGQLVGVYVDSVGNHGFVSNGDKFLSFDVPGGVPGTMIAVGISDAGQVVGFYRDATLGHRVGFVATPVRQ